MNTSKKFYRSRDHKLVAGIMGGIGEYFSIDPVVVRIIFFIFIVCTGFFPGVLAYILVALVAPEEPIASSAPTPEPMHASVDPVSNDHTKV